MKFEDFLNNEFEKDSPITQMNNWLRDHPRFDTSRIVNVETLPDESLRLWYLG